MNKKSILILAVILGLLTAAGIVYQFITNKPVQKDESLTVLMPGTEISALFDDGKTVWAGTGEGIFLLDRESGETLRKLDADIRRISFRKRRPGRKRGNRQLCRRKSSRRR